MVYKKVDKVLLTFPIENVNGKVVGNPVEQFGNYTYYGNKIITHILITCGTNGAKYINDFFIRNIEYFKNQDKYAFILIAGDKYYNDNNAFEWNQRFVTKKQCEPIQEEMNVITNVSKTKGELANNNNIILFYVISS